MFAAADFGGMRTEPANRLRTGRTPGTCKPHKKRMAGLPIPHDNYRGCEI
jgi:hypothetical protein